MSLVAHVRLGLGPLDLDVDLTASAGEVIAVLGPNAAGKTTLLRAIAGLVPLDAGRVTLGGRVLEEPARGVRVPAEERQIGMVFQEPLLFPYLSVLENVAFGPRARGAGRRAARARAREWLERAGLAEVASARPQALSGGQAQAVALARALAAEPALLVLDEPLSALDVEARLSARRLLRSHLATFPGPSLLVTHEPLEAVALADRLVIVEQGRVVQSGTADEVTRRPRSDWSARLAGLNLFRGRASGHLLRLASGETVVASGAVDGPAFAVAHPRAVALYRQRPDGTPRNVWPGSVAGLDARQDRVRVQVAGPVPIVAEVTPAAVAALDLAAGGQVWVAVKASEVELYPA